MFVGSTPAAAGLGPRSAAFAHVSEVLVSPRQTNPTSARAHSACLEVPRLGIYQNTVMVEEDVLLRAPRSFRRSGSARRCRDRSDRAPAPTLEERPPDGYRAGVSNSGGITDKAQRAGRDAQQSEWFDKAIRFGFVVYGVVHLLIGGWPCSWPSARSEGAASSQGAMQSWPNSPSGPSCSGWSRSACSCSSSGGGLEAVFGHRDEDGSKRAGSARLRPQGRHLRRDRGERAPGRSRAPARAAAPTRRPRS